MPQPTISQASGQSTYTTNATGIKYRTTNSGNPLAHNDVDANFELLRAAVNGLVSDHTSQASNLTTLSTSIGSNDTDIAALQVSLGNVQVSLGNVQASVATNSTNIATNTTNIATNTTSITGITDGTTAVPIADGAVTEAKLAAGAVTLNKLDSNISTQLKVSKTVYLHVGNYYKNSTKYWASDLFNYNTTTGRYDARETIVLPYYHSEVPLTWGTYHYDSDAAIITEPFATVSAAVRYALHNHGSNCAISIIVHGHVAWHGDYDKSGDDILDIYKWDGVKKIIITGGRSDDTTGSHYSTFLENGFSSARIDVTHSSNALLYAPGCWLRNPRVFIRGICFTHKHATDPRKHLRGFKIGGESKMYSEFSNIRMNALGQDSSQNDYFFPWHFDEGGDAYFSSGSNQPHEFWTEGNMTLFEVNRSFMLYSNNAPSNQIYLHTVNSGASIRMFKCSNGGYIEYKFSSVQLKTGSNIPDTSINTAGFHHAFNNLRLTRYQSTKLYLPGDLRTNVAQYGNTQNGSAAGYINAANEGGNYNYSDIAFGSARTTYEATNTPSEYGALYPNNTLYGKFTTQANSSSLSKSTLVGDGSTQNFKNAPTIRTGTGGTSSASAPYSDQ